MSYNPRPKYIGEFANNDAALTEIYAQRWDTNGDGTGFPQVGQQYWNTDFGVLRTWDARENYWQGRPQFGAAPAGAVNIFARSTGSDHGGRGTVGDPYLTVLQALQDVPLNSFGETVFPYTINIEEDAATFALPGVVEHYSDVPLTIKGIDPVNVLAFTGGTLAADFLNGAPPQDSRANGRQLTMTTTTDGGGNWTASEYKSYRATVTGNAGGGPLNATGWIYDNSAGAAADMFVEFDSDVYTMGGGDEITITHLSTIATVTGGGVTVKGNIVFDSLDLQVSLGLACEGTVTFNLCTIKLAAALGAVYQRAGGQVVYNDVYTWKNHASTAIFDVGVNGASFEITGGPCVIDGWDGAANRVFNIATANSKWDIVEKLVFAHVSRVDCRNMVVGAVQGAGNLIRLYGCTDFIADAGGGVPGGYSILPYVTGGAVGITGDHVIAINDPEEHIGVRWEFVEAPNVTTGATADGCSIDGGATDGYISEEYGIEILGTGNAERMIMTMELWRASAVAGGAAGGGPAAGLQGAIDTMDFPAGGVDTEAVSHKSIPNVYVEGGFPLALDFEYSTATAVGNQAAMEVYGFLFRPGTDTDIAAVANRHPDVAAPPGGCLAVVESGAADRVTTSVRFALTDAAGQINAIDPSIEDILAVTIRRDDDNTQGVADTLAGAIRVSSVVRVYQTGL